MEHAPEDAEAVEVVVGVQEAVDPEELTDDVSKVDELDEYVTDDEVTSQEIEPNTFDATRKNMLPETTLYECVVFT